MEAAAYWLPENVSHPDPLQSPPQEVSGAPGLERVAVTLDNEPPRFQDLEVLCSLPALRHVVFENTAQSAAVATPSLLRRAVPTLVSAQSKHTQHGEWERPWPWLEGDPFQEWFGGALD